MNKIKTIAAMFIAALLFTVVSCGDSGKNKKISIAYANWAEGIAITNLVIECGPCTYIYFYLP